MQITLTLGQPVRWHRSPSGIAQVDQLRRSSVRLVYRTRTGRLRFPIVPAAAVDLSDVLPFANPLDRGVLARSKTFTLTKRANNDS